MTTDAVGLDFVGAKAALICGDRVLTYLRDDKPGLPWRGMWDLPGGGREGDETAEACLLREVEEEFGLRLLPDRLIQLNQSVSPRSCKEFSPQSTVLAAKNATCVGFRIDRPKVATLPQVVP